MTETDTTKKCSDRTEPVSPGSTARFPQRTLRSYAVGALPIVNRVLNRMRLDEHPRAYLPAEDGRTRVSTPKALMVLVRNLLLSREPLYGIGEWAGPCTPRTCWASPSRKLPV